MVVASDIFWFAVISKGVYSLQFMWFLAMSVYNKRKTLYIKKGGMGNPSTRSTRQIKAR